RSAQPPGGRGARALVAALVAEGVRDVVLAPGSRSAPLAYAVAAAADAGLLTLHVRVDERTAAFLALGLSRGSEPVERPGGVRVPRPVAVVTTSGTAVANLHPAVLEAHHAGVPLVLLTADRPHELRGTGANQTTAQAGLFGPAVRYAVDPPAPDGAPARSATCSRSRGARSPPRPARVTATRGRSTSTSRSASRSCRPPPWRPTGRGRSRIAPPGTAGTRRGARSPSRRSCAPRTSRRRARTVVVAGDGAGPDARALAEARGWPLLAEPSSGALGGPRAVAAHPLVLGVAELVDDVEAVVVLGGRRSRARCSGSSAAPTSR
ncbi:thiamine pyrophosphate-binding protein, partial [Cellulosimicrobium sp. CUA-896]|uniref:thiamine pyrophosphate-binding protein n=1 Tax=Cellulosimicrobium sp. CUA-896 TaxID=1517881 RepID=UPI000B0D9814